MQLNEEQKQEEPEAQAAAANQPQPNQKAVINNEQAAIFNQAGPNIIGNREDMQSEQLAQEEETPQLG